MEIINEIWIVMHLGSRTFCLSNELILTSMFCKYFYAYYHVLGEVRDPVLKDVRLVVLIKQMKENNNSLYFEDFFLVYHAKISLMQNESYR